MLIMCIFVFNSDIAVERKIYKIDCSNRDFLSVENTFGIRIWTKKALHGMQQLRQSSIWQWPLGIGQIGHDRWIPPKCFLLMVHIFAMSILVIQAAHNVLQCVRSSWAGYWRCESLLAWVITYIIMAHTWPSRYSTIYGHNMWHNNKQSDFWCWPMWPWTWVKVIVIIVKARFWSTASTILTILLITVMTNLLRNSH